MLVFDDASSAVAGCIPKGHLGFWAGASEVRPAPGRGRGRARPNPNQASAPDGGPLSPPKPESRDADAVGRNPPKTEPGWGYSFGKVGSDK